MLDPELVDMYESTVTIYPAGARRDDGKVAMGTGVEAVAHVEEGAKRITGSDGSMIDTVATVYLQDDTTAAEGSQVLLPSGRTGIVKMIDRTRSSDGVEVVLRVGKE